MRVALAVSLLIGCADSVEFRICNESDFEMTDIVVGPDMVEKLASFECTPYEARDSIGSSPPAQLTALGEVYSRTPIDGGSFVTAGRWSYRLRVQHGREGAPNAVILRLVEY